MSAAESVGILQKIGNVFFLVRKVGLNRLVKNLPVHLAAETQTIADNAVAVMHRNAHAVHFCCRNAELLNLGSPVMRVYQRVVQAKTLAVADI